VIEEGWVREPAKSRAARGTLVLVVALVLLAAPEHSPATPMLDHLYGVSFANPRDGWVVGAFGTIFRTGDGGETWTAQDSHTKDQLYDVHFVDDRRGWIVGLSGLILHTADGGRTWTRQNSGTDKHLFAVDFADAEHGCAVGDWGIIVTTADGGRTWTSRALENDVILNDVTLLDRSKGWIAGELGTILRTDDGGETWVRQESGVDKTLFAVFFADAERGFTVGIDDGGRTWEVVNGSTEVRALEQVGFSQAYDYPSLYAVSVAGDMGVAVGEIGAVFKSDDGGATWTRRETIAGSKPGWFRAMSLLPERSGAIAGEGGRLVRFVEGQLRFPSEGEGAAEEVH
jgi:photosystem II stability/assembly factor-like uncharacterized protein